MKRYNKITALVMVVAVLAGCMITFAGCNKNVPAETKPTTVQEETVQETKAPAPATEQPQKIEPVLTTKVLDLAGCPLKDMEAAFGTYTLSNEFYMFDGGMVGYVFAYGTDVGSNYITAPLSRLIENCPETLTLEDLQAFLPGGYRDFDEMDEKYCYCWDYRDCTLVLFENADGSYTPDSRFYYNCHTMVEVPVDERVNEEIFEILGMTKSQMDTFFAESGIYDGQFGCMTYSYKNSYVWAYMDDYESGTCIGFYCPLDNVVELSGAVSGDELKEILGDTYQDPWNGDDSYTTMFKGGQLRVMHTYGDEFGIFTSNAIVNFRLAGKKIYDGGGEQYWSNNNSLFYATATVYSQTKTELECAFTYGQMTPPNRIAETGTIKLTSTDGITYTATGVEDNWGNVLTVTVTMLEEAAKITFETTKVGEMANFCFGDFIAYQ